MPEKPFQEKVWEAVSRIPHGRVLSYGDVGLLAGYPRAARAVARVMRLLKDRSEVPWWRVVGAEGEIRIMNPELRREQVRRLREEGVPVSEEGRFPYGEYAWRPAGAAAGSQE